MDRTYAIAVVLSPPQKEKKREVLQHVAGRNRDAPLKQLCDKWLLFFGEPRAFFIPIKST